MPLNNPIAQVSMMAIGMYSGDNTVNRAIAHTLGFIPKAILIMPNTAAYYFQIWYAAAIAQISPTTSGALGITAKDATNFYVGNATSYPQSANASGTNYYWAAFG